MTHRFIIALASAAISTGAFAQANSNLPEGWLGRAQLMLADGNYLGALQQSGHALQLPLSAQEQEEADFIYAIASLHADKPQAAGLLRHFLDAYPASAHRFVALVALGDCYFGSGEGCTADYEQAYGIYSQIDGDALAPAQQPGYFYRKAVCLVQLGRYDEAAESLARINVTSGPYADKALFYWGYISYAQGKMNSAKDMLEAAVGPDAPNNMAHYYLAQIYYLKGDYKAALQAAKQAMQADAARLQPCGSNAAEMQAEALRIAGESAYHLGDNSQAENYLAQYAKLAAEPQPSALYILGLYEYGKANFPRAVQLFTPATALGDAMSQSAYLYIGQALLKEADFDGAIMAFDKALNMDFDPEVQETAYYNYAVASLQGGKVPFGKSVSTFETFLTRYPNSHFAPEVQNYIVASYFNDRDYAGALRSIAAMTQPTAHTQKAKQDALYLLGAQRLEEGKAREAVLMLQQAQQMGNISKETALEATLVLGEALYASRQYADAERQLADYLKQAPASAANRPLAQYDLGYALFQQKKYAKAAEQFSRLIGAGSALPANIQADAACRLGDCYYYEKKFSAAAEAYDRAVAINPQGGDYPLLQKALMEGYQRHHSKKIALIEQLQRDFPASELIPDALLEMTESYIQLGDNTSAIAIYRELGERFPSAPQARQGSLQMALTLLNDGQRQPAIEAYKQVIVKYPTSEEAVQAADALKRLAAADGWLGEYAAFIGAVPGAPQMDDNEAEALSFEAAERDFITGKGTSKLEAYVKAFPSGAGRPKAISYMLQAAQAAGNQDAAYDWACMLVGEFPDSQLAIEAYAQKAQIEEQQGRGTLALSTWQQLAQKASKPYYLNMARLGMARTAIAAEQPAVAEEAASQALASSSLSTADRCQALWLRGEALMRQGRIADARSDWKLAASDMADPYGARCAFALAQSYFDSGDLAAAETEAKALANANTPQAYWVARAFILLSDIYTAQGNEYKAQQYLKSLRDNYPGSEPDIFQMIDQRMKQ